MKKSNIALLLLALVLTAGMVTTGFILKKEAAKIDLSDPLRNYQTQNIPAFKVLKVSGSNGYPIHIQQDSSTSLTVLRRRKGFLKTKRLGDTLEIIFSGANIPLDQAEKNTTPAGVIIKTNAVEQILITNTYNRIMNFRENKLNLQLAGKAIANFRNCQFPALQIRASGNSRFNFEGQNTINNFSIDLQNTTMGFLKNIIFSHLQHQVGDSAAVLLSNQSLTQIAVSQNKLSQKLN